MGWTEIFSNEAEKVLGYLQDLGTLVLSPRKYLQQIAQESATETLRRLTVYVLGFSILEIAVQKAAVPSSAEVSAYQILGVGIFEAAWSLLFLPVFLVTAIFVRADKPLKSAFVYSLTCRLVCLIPILISYGLFLLTENYLFALVKGVLGYGFVLVYVIVLPVSLSKSLKRRAIALVLALVTASLTIVAWGFIAYKTSTSISSWDELSVLYDPIGAEVDDLHVGNDDLEEKLLGEAVDDIGDVGQKALADLKNKLTEESLKEAGGDVNYLLNKTLESWPKTQGQMDWPENIARLRSKWENERKRLEEKHKQAKFNTTKKIIALRLQQLEQGEETANIVDMFLKKPSFDKVKDAYSRYHEMQATKIQSLKHYNEELSIRLWLIKFHLVI